MNTSKRLQYSQEIHTVRAATPGSGTERNIDLQYADAKVIGNGSFGVVYRANLVHNNEDVAIKKVLQDKRFKNRELQIMRKLDHRNVVKLKYFFYSAGEKKDEVYLNLILEYVPETVYRVARHYAKQRQIIPILYIKVYMYQLFRALGYIHSIGICHRDIKPQNLLLNAQTSVLKLCDFGSAKMLVAGEPNVAYICSRYYRAPELIFGATDYTTKIDVWSAGTVLAELLLGQPFFPGDSGVDQLVEIIKVLGTPSREEIQHMNPNYTEFRFPMIRAHPWSRVFRARTPADAIDLVSKLLKYTPNARLSPFEALTHEFFDELRSPNCKLPSSNPMPQLFDFSDSELNIDPFLREKLMPKYVVAGQQAGGGQQNTAMMAEGGADSGEDSTRNEPSNVASTSTESKQPQQQGREKQQQSESTEGGEAAVASTAGDNDAANTSSGSRKKSASAGPAAAANVVNDNNSGGVGPTGSGGQQIGGTTSGSASTTDFMTAA